MIRSFRDGETERIFQRLVSRRLPMDIQRRAQRKLAMVNAAESLNELLVLPGNRLESLSGSRKGQYSIRINDQWRVCFTWSRGDAYEMEVADYH